MTEARTSAARPTWRGALRLALAAPAAVAAGWLGYSKLAVPHNLPLPPALLAERGEINGRAGRLNYYAAGVDSGTPLLLVHSINAAGSPYEMRPIFDRYRASRRVYAPDLPGFGFSERSNRDYTPRLCTDALFDMLDVIQRDTGADAVDAMALSLGGEFLARAASEQPARFRSIALITPTAFGEDDRFYSEPGSVRGNAAVRDVLLFPLWSRPLYDLLTIRPSLRYFLSTPLGTDGPVDQGLLEYGYPTTHQLGAHYAPLSFISAMLFSADISRVYESLDLPVWLGHGTRGQFVRFGGIERLAAKGEWTVTPFQTGALPYYEQPEAFFGAYEDFLAQHGFC